MVSPRPVEVVVGGVSLDKSASRVSSASSMEDCGMDRPKAEQLFWMGSRKVPSAWRSSSLQRKYMHTSTLSRRIPLAAEQMHFGALALQPVVAMQRFTQDEKSNEASVAAVGCGR